MSNQQTTQQDKLTPDEIQRHNERCKQFLRSAELGFEFVPGRTNKTASRETNVGISSSTNVVAQPVVIRTTRAKQYTELKGITEQVKIADTASRHRSQSVEDQSIPGNVHLERSSKLSASNPTSSDGFSPAGTMTGDIINTIYNNSTIVNGTLTSLPGLAAAPAPRSRLIWVWILGTICGTVVLCLRPKWALVVSAFYIIMTLCLRSLRSIWRRWYGLLGILLCIVLCWWLAPCRIVMLQQTPLCQVTFRNALCYTSLHSVLPSSLCDNPHIDLPSSDAKFAYGDDWATTLLVPTDVLGQVHRTVRAYHTNITERTAIPDIRALELEVVHLAWLINNTQSLNVEYDTMSELIWTDFHQKLLPMQSFLSGRQISYTSHVILAFIEYYIYMPLLELLGRGKDYQYKRYRNALTDELRFMRSEIDGRLMKKGQEITQGYVDIDKQFHTVVAMTRIREEKRRIDFEYQSTWYYVAFSLFSKAKARATLRDIHALERITNDYAQINRQMEKLEVQHRQEVATVKVTGVYLNPQKFSVLINDDFSRQVEEWTSFARDQVVTVKARRTACCRSYDNIIL